MPNVEMSEKARQARDKLRATLKADPELAKAFRETVEEMRRPENVKAMSREICANMSAIQKVMELAKRGDSVE